MPTTEFTFPGTAITFPLVLTARDAQDRRSELALALRLLADDIESGAFSFRDGKTLSININWNLE